MAATGTWQQRISRRRIERLVAVAILGVALGARLIYWLQYTSMPSGQVALGADAMEYDEWARAMLARGVLWDRLHIHAPLYPMLLALFYALTGVSVSAASACQLLMDVCSLIMVSVAVWRLVNARAALLTAGLWALYQPLIYYSAQLFSEVLVVFLVSAVLLCWALAHRPGGRLPLNRYWLAASCVFCGLAVITHPLTLFLGVPYVSYAAWRSRFGDLRRTLPVAAAYACLFVLPIAPVTARNAVISGQFVLVQANEGVNLFIGNNPNATGTPYVRPGKEYDDLVNRPLDAGQDTDAEARMYFREHVLRFARTQPLEQLSLWIRKALLTWNASDITSGPDLPQMQVITPFMRVPLVRFGLVAPLGLMAWLWYRKRRLRPFLWAPVLCTAALTLFVTSGRYRLPMIPALIAGAAIGVEALIQAWRRDDRPACIAAPLMAAAGLAVAFAMSPPPIPSSHSETVLLLAEAAWRTDNNRQALRLLVNGIDRRRFNAPMHHLLGNVLEDQGRLPEAIGAFQEALRIDPKRATAALDLGIALARLGLEGEAAAALCHAAELAPDDPSVAYNLGVWRERRGNLEGAERAYRRALQADPIHISAHLNLAVLLQKSGRPAQALDHYRTVLRLRPQDDKALAGIGVYHARQGNPDEAARYFKRAVEANPARDDLRQVYRNLTESREAEAPQPPVTEPQNETSTRRRENAKNLPPRVDN